jgi:nucleotide-binding universal stress UspA family protein
MEGIMKILLAIDGSRFSEAAAHSVVEQTRPQAPEIRVLNVVKPLSFPATREKRGIDRALDAVRVAETKEAEALVTKVADELRSKGLKVTTAVESGDPKSKIIDEASKWHADLIVVGSHGRNAMGHFLLGSVSEAIARHANCSVKIMRTWPKGRRRGKRETYHASETLKIILAIDDLKSSEAAVQAVIAESRPPGAAVLVLHVVEPPPWMVAREIRSHSPALKALWQETEQQAEEIVKQVAQRLRSKGFTVSSAVEKGDPKSRILDVAAKQKPELIVLGCHGRKGLDRFLMGSVSEAVARYAQCSVEVARNRSNH